MIWFDEYLYFCINRDNALAEVGKPMPFTEDPGFAWPGRRYLRLGIRIPRVSAAASKSGA